MKGVYGYLSWQKKWYWYIEILGSRVDSGYCKHKGELQKVFDKNPMYAWYKDTELE